MDSNEKKPDIVSGSELSEKYIRTFAGDMETLKKGGTPELIPLTPPTAAQSQTPPSVAVPIPAPIQPVPLVQIPKPPVYTPAPLESSPIKTYTSDFSQRMKDTRASIATVLAAEQDAVHKTPQAIPEKTFHWNIRIVAGAVLLLVGVTGIYIAYTRYATNLVPITLTPSALTPIFVDDREQIYGTGSLLLQAIEQSVERPLPSGAVRLLYVASTTNADSVFTALRLSAPDILLRNVNPSGSMAGVVNAGPSSPPGTGMNQSPFFILSVLSYSNTFSGMLSWEPFIRRDLEKIFPAYPTGLSTSLVATSTVAATTPNGTTKPATKIAPAPILAFADEVVANHDVRVFRDAAGRSVLLYGYWNQTTLVIARDAAAFTEILQRLATSRAQ